MKKFMFYGGILLFLLSVCFCVLLFVSKQQVMDRMTKEYSDYSDLISIRFSHLEFSFDDIVCVIFDYEYYRKPRRLPGDIIVIVRDQIPGTKAKVKVSWSLKPIEYRIVAYNKDSGELCFMR